MALSFTRVPLVQSGAPITSKQLAKIAAAINDRLRPNAGDWVERLVSYLWALFRQVRNSADEFTFPSQAEFFEAYQNLKASEGSWPAEAPGDPEGANLACIINAFVFGLDGVDLLSEEERITNDDGAGTLDPARGVPLSYGGSVPSAIADIWNLGKAQRGAIDPSTGALASPSFRAAVEHYKIRQNSLSPHGNSYGGFMPIPVDAGGCADATDHNWQIFFTNLNDASVITYPGTCPEEPTHVAAVIPTPRYYFIFLNNGSLEVLPQNEWIEGPYEGGSWVRRQFGAHLPRVLNAFAGDFRGTEAEREQVFAGEAEWLEKAFDTQRFLTQQYQLAPARGVESGEDVVASYPVFVSTGLRDTVEGEGRETVEGDRRAVLDSGASLAAGSLLVNSATGSSSYSYASGYVLASAYIKAYKLAAPARVEFLNGSTVIASVPLEPDGTGAFETIHVFTDAVTPAPLSVRVGADGATFLDSTGYLRVEVSELLEYKPETHDLYLVTRLGAGRSGLSAGLDGSGENEDNSNEISDEYFLYGCVLNHHGATGLYSTSEEVNSNAVFDAARRLSQCVRVLPRAQFTGYEVSGGKSVCYFDRYRTVDGVQVDLFEGIGPARRTSGTIEADIVYTVLGGTVRYNGKNYVDGSNFTGVEGVAEFTTQSGSPVVWEANGIRVSAPKEGFSNQWLMSSWLKVYNPSDESIWKPEAYSDYFPWSERCQWYHGVYPVDLKEQFDYGENVSLAPEALTGWRYVHNTNRWECDEGDDDCKTRRRDRYRSCRIYEPAPEVESAVMESDGTTIKLTFKQRFHHHNGAPAAIARDLSTWDRSSLHAESYRTMENALREYLVYLDDGTHCTGGGVDGAAHNLGQQGNSAYMRLIDSDPWGFPDNPHGACFPHFYFVRLFPKPFEDANDNQDSWDTPLLAEWWRMAELYIRAGCEGFVDGLTSTTVACSTTLNSLFCYTLESLCYDAFGGKWFSTMGTASTLRLGSGDVRTDAPQGFGQLPNTLAAAEVYNQFAAALNKLTRVQIMLPQSFQVRTYTGDEERGVAATWPEPAPTCSTMGQPKAYYRGDAPDPGSLTAGAWGDASVVVSEHSGSLVCDRCDGSAWILAGHRQDEEWRWALTDPDAYHALPEIWQTLFGFDGGSVYMRGSRLLGIRTISETRKNVQTVSDISEASHCLEEDGYWVAEGGYLKFTAYTAEDSTACEIVSNSGRLHTNSLGGSVYEIGRDTNGNGCCGGANRLEQLEPLIGDDTAFVEIELVDEVSENQLLDVGVTQRITVEGDFRTTAEGEQRVPSGY